MRCHAPCQRARSPRKIRGTTCSRRTAHPIWRWTGCRAGVSPDLGTGTRAGLTCGGGFDIAQEPEILGPHENPFAMPCVITPASSPCSALVRRSALCATCHTLFTDALAPDGSQAGAQCLEQAPYLEWKNSAFNDERPGDASARGLPGVPRPHTGRPGRAPRNDVRAQSWRADWPPTSPRSVWRACIRRRRHAYSKPFGECRCGWGPRTR